VPLMSKSLAAPDEKRASLPLMTKSLVSPDVEGASLPIFTPRVPENVVSSENVEWVRDGWRIIWIDVCGFTKTIANLLLM
jgi:hypothetical protein